jgi:hypothetical protein
MADNGIILGKRLHNLKQLFSPLVMHLALGD